MGGAGFSVFGATTRGIPVSCQVILDSWEIEKRMFAYLAAKFFAMSLGNKETRIGGDSGQFNAGISNVGPAHSPLS